MQGFSIRSGLRSEVRFFGVKRPSDQMDCRKDCGDDQSVDQAYVGEMAEQEDAEPAILESVPQYDNGYAEPTGEEKYFGDGNAVPADQGKAGKDENGDADDGRDREVRFGGWAFWDEKFQEAFDGCGILLPPRHHHKDFVAGFAAAFLKEPHFKTQDCYGSENNRHNDGGGF